jgi:hypothetical protein
LLNKQIHTWEMNQITLKADRQYKNAYTDVECWIDLKGPDFPKRVYGFWDSDNIFIVRIVATKPGKWTWTSGSNQPGDDGLNNQSGQFRAFAWGEEEKQQNPNRRGFIRPSAGGHALQYADGTPFFLAGDTWLAGATWRLPFRGVPGAADYVPGPVFSKPG